MKYDLIVLGGGAAGLSCAVGATLVGAKVLLIEKNKLGGDCLYHGCIPSKTLIQSAKVAELISRAKEYGLQAKQLPVDLSAVMQHVHDTIETVGDNDQPKRFERMVIKVVFGAPCFIDKHTIAVNHVQYTAKRIVIATGSHPLIPQIKGLDTIPYLTNVNIFELKKLPEHLIVIGSGPIGIEMAQAFLRLGSKVSVIVHSKLILSKEDKEIASLLQQRLAEEGIVFYCNTDTQEVVQDKNSIIVRTKQNDRSVDIKGSHLLIATGRSPNIEGLGLERAGIAHDAKRIFANAKLQTNVKDIYAIGDINGEYLFTHAANYEAGIAVQNALFGLGRKADYGNLPWTTFTDPELARIGLHEEDCKAQGITYVAYKHEFKKVDRAQAEIETHGMVKILCDKKGKILGASILGAHAGEMIHELLLAKKEGIPVSSIAQTVHVYPTLAEAVKKAAEGYYRERLFTPAKKRLYRFLMRLRR